MIAKCTIFERLSRSCFKSQAAQGLSLLEMAMVMVIVSISLMPLLQTLNGVRGNSGEGPADRITAYKSKEALMANTLIEQALSGDYNNINCGSFNPGTAPNYTDGDFPLDGQTKQYSLCTSSNYNRLMYYRWSIYSVPNLPAQNHYYRASLNVYNSPTGTSIMTLQTNFFRNVGAYASVNNLTGIMLAMDISGSMTSAKVENAGLQTYDGIASPYMFYRYNKALYEGTTYGTGSGKLNFPANSVPGHISPGLPGDEVILNMWDDSQIDMSFAQALQLSMPPNTTTIPDFSDPDTSTAYNEKFPYSRTNNPPNAKEDAKWGEGVLGTGDCGKLDKWSNADPAVWGSSDPNSGDVNVKYTFLPGARKDTGYVKNYYIGGRISANQLCQVKDSPTDLSDTLNLYMSRIEAARTGALSMLLSLESNPSITQSLQVGFIPWSNIPDTDDLIVPETPIAVSGTTGLHFVASRNKFLWINRADPSNINSTLPVKAAGSTNIYLGLEAARIQLMAKSYGRRVIVLLTDGEPNPNSGSNSTTSLKSYSLNTIGKNAADDKQITLFTIGLISADQDLLGTMANNTTAGQAYFATDLSQVKGIFEAISYQIQKLALLNAAKRYGLTL